MSEPTTTGTSTGDSTTQAAGEGISDREMIEAVAGQTDSASEHAQDAGKDWDGDASKAPEPTE